MKVLRISVRLCLVVLIVLSVATPQVQGGLVIFQGIDPGVGPGGARPNSNAAAALFDAAAGGLGPLSLITFEGLPVGNFSSLTVAPGVTVTLGGTAADANAGITNILGDATLGYNTTLGGNQHLRFVPTFAIPVTTATFAFDTPVQAFGAYFTGIGTVAGTIQLVFDDGSQQTLTLPGSPNGGVQFFGFTDPGAAIATVTVRETRVGLGVRDIFGIDDVRTAAIPEPGSLTLLCLGVVGLVGVRWCRRRNFT